MTVTAPGRGCHCHDALVTTFVAHDHHADYAKIAGWAVRGSALAVAIMFVVLGLTGVIPVFDSWFMPAFIALAVIAMLFLVPRTFTQRADLLTAHPLLQLHSDGLAYAGSHVTGRAVTGVLRADLGSQDEHSSYEAGDAFYVHVDPDRLTFTRRDALIDTKRRRLVIRPKDFADPGGMARALVTHLERQGITYADCGSSTAELRRAEDRLKGG